MTYDLVIRGGTVVDGSGLPRYAPTSDVARRRRPSSRRCRRSLALR